MYPLYLNLLRTSRYRLPQFLALIALVVVGGFAEFISIGMIIPFLAMLVDPEGIQRIAVIGSAILTLAGGNPQAIPMTVTLVFVASAAAAAVTRVALSWMSHRFAFALGHDIGVALQERLLDQPYIYHLRRNSAELIAAQEKVQIITFNLILPLILGASSILIAGLIMAILLYIAPLSSAITAGLLGGIYLGVNRFSKGRLERNSRLINESFVPRVQLIQESLGGIRDIIIDHSQPIYVEQFRSLDRRFRRAQAYNLFLGAWPRFAVEGFGIVVIAFVALFLTGRHGGIMQALPILGVLALGAQRLLPLVQQMYSSWTLIRSNSPMAAEIAELLELPSRETKVPSALAGGPALLRDRIAFADVSFRYPGRREPALSNVSFELKKGESAALIGHTGSGKSTLIDILMGLLVPTQGSVTIDGSELAGATLEQWQRQIAHVPQMIFLADTTLARNVAFGASAGDVDMDAVYEAAARARLHDFVLTLPDGYETRVGERGVQLSGGQRQRLGIARALYRQAKVLILDEATSALDGETEAAVIGTLREGTQGMTIVMIAHRLSTIMHCDTVIRLEGGKITAMGSFDSVVGPTVDFQQS